MQGRPLWSPLLPADVMAGERQNKCPNPVSACGAQSGATTRVAPTTANRRLPQQPPIDSRLRALDGHRADGLCIIGRGADAPNDRIAEALLPHGLKAGEQEAGAGAELSGLRHNAGRAEEIATRRVVAGEAGDPP